MSEPGKIRRKSLHDMQEQLSRIRDYYTDESPRYKRALSAYRRYSNNILNTRKSISDRAKIKSTYIYNEYMGIKDDKVRKLNDAVDKRKYARRTYTTNRDWVEV